MTRNPTLALAVAAACASHGTTAVAAVGNEAALQVKEPRAAFLSPIEPDFVMSERHPMYPGLCTRLPGKGRCPVIVTGGGGTPHLDLPLASHLPHLRVTMFVQTISNQIVANGGVQGTLTENFRLLEWETTGPEADAEKGGPYAWGVPGPGESFDAVASDDVGPNGLGVYDALVFNACDTLSSFDLEHDAAITDAGVEIGAFSGSDTSTIDSTGYYDVSYTLRATDADGGVSDFHIGGKVNVICSGLNALPE